MASDDSKDLGILRFFTNALVGLIATSFTFFIGLTITQAPWEAFVVAVPCIFVLVLVITIDRKWPRHKARCAVITFTQRGRFYLLSAIAGASGMAVLIQWVLPMLGLSLFHSAPVLLERAMKGFIVVAIAWAIWLVLYLIDRVPLTAVQCHTVLKRIARQWETGIYSFELEATNAEIRQESRFLDYLARRSHGSIQRRRGGYVFAGGRNAHVALKHLCAGMIDGQLATAIQCSNDHWRRGSQPRARWRRVGKPAFAPEEEPHAKHFFGNGLDKLFNGGDGLRVRMPAGPDFLTMVIKGQPGAGKSTQALQLCVTLAQQGHYCLYYAHEEERESLLQTARNFRWSEEDLVTGYAGVHHLDFETRETDVSRPGVWVSSLGDRAMPLAFRKRQLHAEWQKMPNVPRCVVIDSLEGYANVGIDRESQSGVPRSELLALKDFFRDRCQILVIVVEDDGSGKPGYVDFVADVVIWLGREVGEDYTLLSAEVLKARNQNHALGRHQIKIRSQDDINRASGPVKDGLRGLDPGIIVYPSLHYVLFQTQHRPTTADYFLSSGLGGLDQMLPGIGIRTGVRRQSTLAVLGPTGTGKSVIALNFLVEGVRENTPTMLVLLHGDPATIITSGIPQEPHRMHFSWRTERDALTGGSHMYHQFSWTIDGIARWWGQRNALSEIAGQSQAEPPTTAEEIGGVLPSLLRLPYLFRLGPLSHPITREELPLLMDAIYRAANPQLAQRWQAVTQALAVRAFLRALMECCPPASPGGTPRWDAPARRQLRETFDAAWSALVESVGPEALVLANNSSGAPKRIQLINAEDDVDETLPTPYLTWDSRSWDRHLPGTDGAGGTIYDTSLLVIREYRPGNISPEDFLDRLLREIGDPKGESIYGRIVFDGISQIGQRFPLLASSRMFLPTLIDLFKATGITSLFLADTEADENAAQDRGITIMADQVIRTSVQFVADDQLAPRGRYNQREIIAEVDARPGDARHAPHILRFTEIPSRFTSEEQTETQVTLEALPGPHT